MDNETEAIDLKALANKARPSVMLLVVSDANGKEIATVTGFVVSSDGKLITNFHVIEKAASAVAKAENGGMFPVEGVLASDPKNDLVLLKLKGKDLPFLTLGKSENIEVGTRIAVIGSPLGREGTLSEGIVSAMRELMVGCRVELLECQKLEGIVSAVVISSGSTGSPMLNAKGDVVGIISSLISGGNFVVPVGCLNQLLATAEVSGVSLPLAKGAINQGDSVIYSDPDWRAARFAEAKGDYLEMLKCATALVARYPKLSATWFAFAYSLGKFNLTPDVITALQQAIKVGLNDAKKWRGLGDGYRQLGRTADAITAYQRAVELEPNDANAWYTLGKSFSELGRTDDAIEAYERAIELDPDNAEVWRGLVEMYYLIGRTADAITACERAIEHDPDNTAMRHFLALLYEDSGRTDDVEGSAL